MIQFCTNQAGLPTWSNVGLPRRRALSQSGARTTFTEAACRRVLDPPCSRSSRTRARCRKSSSGFWRCFPCTRWESFSISGGPSGHMRKQSASFLEVFRKSNKFSEVQAVCATLKDSPLVGLFQAGYAELTAQLRLQTPAVDPAANPPKPAARSCSQEPGGRRSRLDSRVCGGGEQAREARRLSRHDRGDYAVHRALRHRRRHHDRLSGHRAVGLHEPRRRLEADRRRAGRHGERPRGRDSGGVLLQHADAPGEDLRVRDG